MALIATWLLGHRVPRMSLLFWQAVMAIALLVPFAQPARGDDLLRLLVQSAPIASVKSVGASLNPTRLDPAIIVIAILAIGILLRLSWLAFGMFRLRAIVNGAVTDPAMEQDGVELAESVGVAAAIRISDDIDGPATVGARRPVILVPRSVLGMSPAVRRAILCHELLHVKRRDWLFTIAEELWCAMLWFHPAARVIASRLSLAREMIVDELTILTTRDRRAYAEALLAFSDPQPHLIGATPFIGRRTLGQRIFVIAQEVPMSHRRALVGFAIALTAVIGSAAVAVDRFPMSSTLDAQSAVYELKPGNGVVHPSVVREVKPGYTREAMQKKIQGSVFLSMVVTDKGDVSDIAVTKSLDAEYGLDQQAIDAARKWKFKPATKDGQPVAARITLELTFKLK
ncbi:MAG TPA: M56 family metallopeptidase [Bradyrhizobium sp.]|nr:M56 family metallopeptidase [Bradyrhizobium sp.]